MKHPGEKQKRILSLESLFGKNHIGEFAERMSFSGDFILKFTEGWGNFPTQKTKPLKLNKEAENCFFVITILLKEK